jgi:hypothetical protein
MLFYCSLVNHNIADFKIEDLGVSSGRALFSKLHYIANSKIQDLGVPPWKVEADSHRKSLTILDVRSSQAEVCSRNLGLHHIHNKGRS